MKEVITGTRHYTSEFMKALQRELSLAIKKVLLDWVSQVHCKNQLRMWLVAIHVGMPSMARIDPV